MGAELTTLLGSALGAVLWISAPAVLAAALAGGAAGLLQTLVQAQDATLGFVPRLLAVGAALALAGGWMVGRIVALTTELWQTLP